jgi:hypothetical protein
MNNSYNVVVLTHDYQVVCVIYEVSKEDAEVIAYKWKNQTDSEGRKRGYRVLIEQPD